jgi:hypothetical protein
MDELLILTDKGVSEILKILDIKAGVEENEDKKKAYREAIFDVERHKVESLAEFVARRSRQWDSAAAYGMIFPDDAKGIMLIEGSKLSQQNEVNLRTLTGGLESFQRVAPALRKLDVPKHHVTSNVPAQAYWQGRADQEDETDEESEGSDEQVLLELWLLVQEERQLVLVV